MEKTELITKVLQNLLSEVTKFYTESKSEENERWERGESFNIFNTIGLWSEEVRLHSALIGELLNPNGSHGASSLFLKAFLDVMGIDEGYLDYGSCSPNILERVIGAVTETDGGRIDIIIEDGKRAIIIENKIYAPDQKNQLLRYHNYGKKKFPKGYELLYLTLDGHDPSDGSLGGKEFDYKSISYETEIVEWLEKCLKVAPDGLPVSSVIRQYIDLIKQLTYTDMDTKYVEELKSVALAPENVLAVGELFKIQNEWLNGLLEIHVWNPLRDYTESKGMKFMLEHDGAYIFREEWRHYAICAITERQTWSDLFVGVTIYNEPKRADKLFKKDYVLLNCLVQPSNEYYPYGSIFLPEPIRNWGYHITEEIVNGDVFNWIKNKIDEILSELDERNLRMP